MKMGCLKLPLTLILFLLSFFALVNISWGQDDLIHPCKFTIDSLQHLEPESQNPKFKITLSDPWLGRDKVHHFLTSAFLSGAAYYFWREEQNYSNKFSQQVGFCFSISLGLVKEIRDGFKSQNAFSVKDLAADVFGTLVGIILISN